MPSRNTLCLNWHPSHYLVYSISTNNIHRLSIWNDWKPWLATKENNDQHYRINWTWNVPRIKKSLFQKYSILYSLYTIECLCGKKESFYKTLIGLCNREKFPKLKYLVLESIDLYALFSMIDSIHEGTGQSEWFEALRKIDQHSIRDVTIRIS